ncbi:hypothetical protein PV325_013724, partial [Microctonus aethiopoides]
MARISKKQLQQSGRHGPKAQDAWQQRSGDPTSRILYWKITQRRSRNLKCSEVIPPQSLSILDSVSHIRFSDAAEVAEGADVAEDAGDAEVVQEEAV